ncbi:MAG TPA: bifunctional demethylmenaquinone methyltransferase/2-methoxy-6-polyprenyl-1,4-benzoquinol methylase UbiE [Thermoanaerobaculia bacterium]|nr:bifunctional demethylmenaquinone methyltransferase/2-methoxy-6-polyprenyl-1,4-benzoquinol methylase UbiE [Thermoanaerobaculia bacterium]
MRNKYLSYDEKRASKVNEMFSRLAGRYDLVNDVMSFGLHRRWKRDTVELGLKSPARPLRWLDLCCGTGDMSFLAERLAGQRPARVTGLDFTLPMLAVACRRRPAEGSTASYVQGDALRLPFRDGSFDVVSVGYGLRNLADLPRGLSEMRRVLASRGRAVVLDFGKPDNPAASALYWGFLKIVMPLMGWLFHRDPETYAYIPASLERYPAQRGVEKLMKDAGFVNVGYENRLLGTMGINVGEAPKEV